MAPETMVSWLFLACLVVVTVYMITSAVKGPYCPHHCPRPRPKNTGLTFLELKKVKFLKNIFQEGWKVAKEFDDLKGAKDYFIKCLQGEQWPFRNEEEGNSEIVNVQFVFQDDVGNTFNVYFHSDHLPTAHCHFPLINIPDKFLVIKNP